jgi:hypothetical protein
MNLEDTMEREIDYSIPETQKTITVGEMRRMIADFPDDFPLTVLTPFGDWWFNVGGITKGDGEHSIILATRDDFDTRQW